MDQEKRSLFQRIRNIRQSLDNAEKSFQDDRGMRGELDLMLAEAEMKNLRNKQTVPWSWNRHVFALSIAILLCVSGLCGWYFAKGSVTQAEAVPAASVQQVPQASIEENKAHNITAQATPSQQETQKNIKAIPDKPQETIPQVQLSERDMRNLVRSAKNELSSGK